MQKKIQNFLIILLIAQSINLVLFEGVKITSEKLGTFIYSITSQPFLEQSLQLTQSQQLNSTFAGSSKMTVSQR